jgi:hypothetical protein
MKEYLSDVRLNSSSGNIYYSAGNGNGLFKLGLNTKQKKTLSYDHVGEIFAVQGNWVYFDSRDSLFYTDVLGSGEFNVSNGKRNDAASAVKSEAELPSFN